MEVGVPFLMIERAGECEGKSDDDFVCFCRCSFEGCDRVYSSQQSLKKHEKSHIDPLPYKVNFY